MGVSDLMVIHSSRQQHHGLSRMDGTNDCSATDVRNHYSRRVEFVMIRMWRECPNKWKVSGLVAAFTNLAKNVPIAQLG